VKVAAALLRGRMLLETTRQARTPPPVYTPRIDTKPVKWRFHVSVSWELPILTLGVRRGGW